MANKCRYQNWDKTKKMILCGRDGRYRTPGACDACPWRRQTIIERLKAKIRRK